MKKFLKHVYEMTGGPRGVIAVQIDRTSCKVIYKRSDNFWVCFFIKVKKLNIYEDGRLKLSGDIMEQYPCNNDFGITAWKGSETVIRRRYQEMKEQKCLIF